MSRPHHHPCYRGDGVAKQVYRSIDEAHAAAFSMRAAHPDKYHVYPYRCHACDRYHVGRRGKRHNPSWRPGLMSRILWEIAMTWGELDLEG